MFLGSVNSAQVHYSWEKSTSMAKNKKKKEEEEKTVTLKCRKYGIQTAP